MKAYILVGESKRLPKKHLMEVVKGKRLIDLVVDNLKKIGFDVVIYSKYPLEIDVPVLVDKTHWILPSVISLLRMDSNFFLFGGDMPLLKKDAVTKIIDVWQDGITIIPKWSSTQFLEPLHGLYTKNVLSCLEEELGREKASLTHALNNCPHIKFIPAEELGEETFFNVNTPEDMEKLRVILERRR